LQVLEYDYANLMKKYGPQDVGYAVLWDAKDESFVQKITDNTDFIPLCEKGWNDHRINFQGIEPLQISKASDLVTYPGLSYAATLITGANVTRFTFMCCGSDSAVSSPFQQLLNAEAASRINMSISGSMTRSGTALRFVGNFPSSFQTITARESGVNTVSTPNSGILLNRNAFPTPISHTSGGTAFTLASLITFTSVTTWG